MQTVKAALSRFFGSRKMALGIIGIAVIVISYLAPELAPRAEQIGNLVFAVVGVVSGTIMVEDSFKVWANRPKTLAEGLSMAREGLTSTTTTSATVVTSSVTPPIKVDMTPGKEDPPPSPKIDPPSMEGIPG